MNPRCTDGQNSKEVDSDYASDSIVLFRNKRSQAKCVYYVFLYKQYVDNIYTQVAFHRFPLGSLVVGWSPSSPPQSGISPLAQEHSHCGSWILSEAPSKGYFAPADSDPDHVQRLQNRDSSTEVEILYADSRLSFIACASLIE